MTDSTAQKIKGEVTSHRFSFFSGVSPLLAASPLTLLFVGAAALAVFLFPATPLLVVIPLCLVLGAVIFIPWGLEAQGLLCLVATLSYTLAVYPNFTSQSARDYVFAYLSLGVGVLASLLGVSRHKSQQAWFSHQTAGLQQKILEAEVLQEFGRALTPALDCSVLLPALTQAAQRLCQPQGLTLGLLLPARQELELWTRTDLSVHGQRIPLEDVFARKILQVGWPVYIADLSTPPLTARLLQLLKDLGYASLLVVPLRAAHRVVGVLLAEWRTQRTTIPPHEEELLQFLADQTAQALANIRLYADQERHLSESEALRRVGQSISATLNLQDILRLVAGEGARLLGCEAGLLTLCTPENEIEVVGASGFLAHWRGSRIPLAESLTDMVMRERRAIRQVEVHETDSRPLVPPEGTTEGAAPQSLLAVPLWQEERPMGALTVLSTTPRTFSLDDERILQTLADQAVHGITNAQLYARLQHALQREQEANHQKSAFFASVSHELRTPLNIILGYIDLIREGVIGQVDHSTAETLGRVRKSVMHLIALINDLLDLARIERAEFQIHLEPVDIENLLQETCSQWEQVIHDKELSFQRVGECPLPVITTDKARLRQVLDNLLGNAVKFTTAGHIAVGASVPDHSVEIWVEDTGIGIEPVDQGRIFDEFQQVESGKILQSGGVGLGLAVSKKLVRLLGGTLKVESSPGRGSTFTVTLPRNV
ncbi:MAG TPA: GAF domain-containing sensor histidine kinase [Candidatus Binatia bacterium]|jgi:signal transduction histidine kinase|nr:GAF domain-containing sensor histidine kinase [Candidatus Binatia bacterium]